MDSFDLDTRLMQFGTGDDLSQSWLIRHSILGLQCFGSNGSGKSSSMKTLALKLLRAGYGFLILSAKSERETWEEYCRLAGRSDDLIRIGVDSPHRFDFMKYLSKSQSGAGLTSNLLNILFTVIKTIDNTEDQKSSDPFWDKSVRLLLHRTITLAQLANNGEVTIQEMYDIIQSAPKGSEDGDDADTSNDDPDSVFNKSFEAARKPIADVYKKWKKGWTKVDRKRFKDRKVMEAAFLKHCPDARRFKFVEQFFDKTFKTLSHKTRSVILMSVSTFLFSLLEDPIYTLICTGDISVTPEDTYLNSKVILLDIPTKFYHGAGRSAQLLFKLIFQLQIEKRNIALNSRPVCIWSDESAEFLMVEQDALFQATARSSLVPIARSFDEPLGI